MHGLLKRRGRAVPPLSDLPPSRTTSFMGADDSTAAVEHHHHHHHHQPHTSNRSSSSSSSEVDNPSTSRRLHESIAGAAANASAAAPASRARRPPLAALFRASARALRSACMCLAALSAHASPLALASLARRCTRAAGQHRRRHPSAFAAAAALMLTAFLLCGLALLLGVCAVYAVVAAEAAAVAARAPYLALAGGDVWVSDAPAVQLRTALRRYGSTDLFLVRFLSVEVVTAVHEASVAALALVGVDLAMLEWRLAEDVAPLIPAPRDGAGADVDGGAGRGACCPGACVSRRAGNASVPPWDATATPPPPFALDGSAAADACPRRASLWTSSAARPPPQKEEQQQQQQRAQRHHRRPSGRAARRRELADRDSTVLMIFDPLSTRTAPDVADTWFAVDEVGMMMAMDENDGDGDATGPNGCGGVEAGTVRKAAPGGTGRNSTAEDVAARWRPFCYTRRRIERAFHGAAAAFVSDRHDPFRAAAHATHAVNASREQRGADTDAAGSPYMTFVRQQRATLWELYAPAQTTDDPHNAPPPPAQHEKSAFPTATRSPRRLARPLRMDVVYTYVAPQSPSHQRARAARGLAGNAGDAHRMRDWGELRHALRSLDAHALGSRALQHDTRQLRADAAVLETEMGIEVSPGVRAALAAGGDGAVSLLGDIFLVVADVDQVPAWVRAWRHTPPLNATAAAHALRVVTHAQLLERATDAVRRKGGDGEPGGVCQPVHRTSTPTAPLAEGAPPRGNSLQSPVRSCPCLFFENQSRGAVSGPVLPTFNSRVIESLLHHTPGLSRFYLYATNDQLLGQRLSLFDLWRPLAPARQEMRFAAYAAEVATAQARHAPPWEPCRPISSNGSVGLHPRDAGAADAGGGGGERNNVIHSALPTYLAPADRAGSAQVPPCRATPSSPPPPPPRSARRALFLEPLLQREVTVSPWQPTVQPGVRHPRNTSAARPPSASRAAGDGDEMVDEPIEADAESAVQHQLQRLRGAAAEALRACEPVRRGAPHRTTSASGQSRRADDGELDADADAGGEDDDAGEADDAPRRRRTVMPGRTQPAATDAEAAAAAAGLAAFDRCVAAVTSRQYRRRPDTASATTAEAQPPPFAWVTTTGLATRALMRVPAWQLESAHGRQQWHMTLEHWDGVTPALTYSHAMTLLDREWVGDALDDAMRDELQLLRLHSTRFRYGEFIPVSAFVYYAVAMRRWVDRQLWALGLEDGREHVIVGSGGGPPRGVADAADAAVGVRGNVTSVLALRPPARRAVASASLLDPFTSVTLHDAAAVLASAPFPADPHGSSTNVGGGVRRAVRHQETTAHTGEGLAAADVDRRLASLAHGTPLASPPLPPPAAPPLLSTRARDQLDRERRRRDELRSVMARGDVATRQLGLCRQPHPRRIRMDDLGPLYGDAHAVHVQHPLLFDHLASWWLAAGLAPSPHPCWTNPLRDGPRTRPDLLRFAVLLRHAMPLPHLRVHQRGTASDTAAADGAAVQRRQRQRTRQWKALFLDVDYHWRDGWPGDEADDDAPWQFLYNPVSASPPHRAAPPSQHAPPFPRTTDALGFAALSSLEQMEALTHRFRTSPLQRPVQCVFNDNFPPRASALVDGVLDQTWNETFAQLMEAYTGRLPRSRWEEAASQH